MRFFTRNDRAHTSSLGLLCLPFWKKEAGRPNGCFWGQHEGSVWRKLLPAKNGAGEKRRRRKIGAGENFCRRNSQRKILPSKFAATNGRRQNCREIRLRRESNFEMAKFRVIFEGSHRSVVVGGEKPTEMFSPPESLCLQVQNSTAKFTANFTAPKLFWPCPFTNKWFWAHCFQCLTVYAFQEQVGSVGLVMTNALARPISCWCCLSKLLPCLVVDQQIGPWPVLRTAASSLRRCLMTSWCAIKAISEDKQWPHSHIRILNDAIWPTFR